MKKQPYKCKCGHSKKDHLSSGCYFVVKRVKNKVVNITEYCGCKEFIPVPREDKRSKLVNESTSVVVKHDLTSMETRVTEPLSSGKQEDYFKCPTCKHEEWHSLCKNCNTPKYMHTGSLECCPTRKPQCWR